MPSNTALHTVPVENMTMVSVLLSKRLLLVPPVTFNKRHDWCSCPRMETSLSLKTDLPTPTVKGLSKIEDSRGKTKLEVPNADLTQSRNAVTLSTFSSNSISCAHDPSLPLQSPISGCSQPLCFSSSLLTHFAFHPYAFPFLLCALPMLLSGLRSFPREGFGGSISINLG